MRSIFASVPVLVAAVAGFFVNSDQAKSPLNPFQSIERIENVPVEIDTTAIEAKLAGYHGESMTAINSTREELGGEVRTLASRIDEVHTVNQTLVSRVDELEKETKAFGEAGLQLPTDRVETSGQCNCVDCLDEADVRRIVRDEFNNQVLAEKQAPRSSIPNAVSYSAPAVTYSQPVYYSQPVTYASSDAPTDQPATRTTVRRGVFGRTIYRTSAPKTCRMVHGVKVCN